MTTVAWDGKTLAADSQATVGAIRARVVKIVRSPDGFLAAGAGELNSITPWLRWVSAGLNPDEQPDELHSKSHVIIIDPKGKAFTFEGSPTRLPLLNKFWALGSGMELALGAMAMGADARTAVKVAAKFDVYTGGRIVVLTPRNRDLGQTSSCDLCATYSEMKKA